MHLARHVAGQRKHRRVIEGCFIAAGDEMCAAGDQSCPQIRRADRSAWLARQPRALSPHHGGYRSKIPTAGHGAASPTFTAFALDGQAVISPDRVPLGLTKMNSDFQERIIAILQESPNGLTSNEIAERLGATAKNLIPLP